MFGISYEILCLARLHFENHLYGQFRHYNKSRDLLSHRIGLSVVISRELNRWGKRYEGHDTKYDIIIHLDMLDFRHLTLISATTTIAVFPTLVPRMNICNDREF